MNDEDTFVKEGDIVLIDSKDDNSITEVRFTDISPSGEYIEVTAGGPNRTWVHMNRHLETLEVASGDDSEFEDVDVTAQDILARIRNRAEVGIEKFDVDEPIESVVIQMDKFVELDLRNKKK